MANEDTAAPAGSATGGESSLSTFAGPYVSEMLGRGQALGSEGYNAYMGPLTAGTSDLQSQAFGGIAGLNIPSDQMGGFTPQTFDVAAAQQYMNPYIMSALQPQIDEARRQSEIDRVANASRMTRAGSFGGSRQAVLDAENQRALQSNLAGITGKGYLDAYNQAMGQFNTEQDRGITAQEKTNQYGLAALGTQADAGTMQRGIESEGILADRMQFEEERDFPYKQVQYMQSLLDGLPISAQNYSYAEPSFLSETMGAAGGIKEMYDLLYGKSGMMGSNTAAGGDTLESLRNTIAERDKTIAANDAAFKKIETV